MTLDDFNNLYPEGNEETWDEEEADDWQEALNLLEGAQEVMEKVLRNRKLRPAFSARLYKELEDQSMQISAFNNMMEADDSEHPATELHLGEQ